MANYNNLKTAIQAVIKANGNQEITGDILQNALLSTINSLGEGYQFIGVATPATNPGTPDQKVFYVANGKGTYTNFGGISITEDEIVILYYDTAWHKLLTGIASQEKLTELGQKIDGLVGNYSAGFINTSRDSTDFTIVYNPAYVVGVFDTYDGNIFKVTGHAGEGPRLWAFTDDAGTIISKSVNDANKSDFLLISPVGATKLIVNFISNETHSLVSLRLNDLNSELALNKIAHWTDDILLIEQCVFYADILINTSTGVVVSHPRLSAIGNMTGSLIIKCKPSHKYSIYVGTTEPFTTVAFLTSNKLTIGSVANFAGDETLPTNILINEEQYFVSPQNAEYLLISIPDGFTGLFIKESAFVNSFAGFNDVTNTANILPQIISNGTNWLDGSIGVNDCLSMGVKAGEFYRITALGNTNIALVQTTDTNDKRVFFVTTQQSLLGGQSKIIYVPYDCALYVLNTLFSNALTPKIEKVETDLVSRFAENKIRIAASNSSIKDKMLADLLCDGNNDTDVFTWAIDMLTSGGTIQLLDGDYYLSKINSNNVVVEFGFNKGNARTINLEGTTENKGYNTEYGVTIHVTQSCISSMNDTNTYSIICGNDTKPIYHYFSSQNTYNVGDIVYYNDKTWKCVVPVTTPGEWTGNANWLESAYYTYTFVNNVNIRNLYLKIYQVSKKIIGINCENFGSSYLYQVGVYNEDYFDDRFLHRVPQTPCEGSIGIASNRSSNDEMALIGFDFVNVGGFYIGYRFNRVDHVVMRSCFAARNCFGYWFIGANSKTFTMLNCSDEGNTHMPHFERGGMLTAIDYNLEQSPYAPLDPTGDTERFATEDVPGSWRGFISFSGMQHFWKKDGGHGKNFTTVNLEHQRTVKPELKSGYPEYLERIYNEQTNKWETWNGTEWISD